ncbi:Aspartic protease [Grifola frondosa]|uniref:Aspartic protease n=1 Tax=Grifola frondosa TaxID=5627 RepID=A0A1C7LML1_GRIFR|nr:Aspartic protease [Grifola frondosa]
MPNIHGVRNCLFGLRLTPRRALYSFSSAPDVDPPTLSDPKTGRKGQKVRKAVISYYVLDHNLCTLCTLPSLCRLSGGASFRRALQGHLAQISTKYQKGFAAFELNMGEAHPLAGNNLLRKRFAAEQLTDDGEHMWQGDISVGTPPQTYTVDFDTGSSDLFLPGPHCDYRCKDHKVYDPSASSSSKNLFRSFALGYGDGSEVKGEQFSDSVQFSGLTATAVTLGVSTDYSSGFAKNAFTADGLMGMAFKSISAFPADPFVSSLATQNQIEDAVFAFKLAKEGSELSLGGYNPALFTGDIVYTPVTKEGYWQVSMDSISTNGTHAFEHVPAIIDTGTTLIIADKESVDAIYAGIPGAKDASHTIAPGFYTVPCDAIPTVSLTFGGKTFDVKPELFNQGPAGPEDSSDCIGGISALEGQEFWIVGDVFCKTVVYHLDMKNSQVGFAALA